MSSQLNVTTAVRRDLAEPPALAAEMGVLYLVVGTRKQRFDQKRSLYDDDLFRERAGGIDGDGSVAARSSPKCQVRATDAGPKVRRKSCPRRHQERSQRRAAKIQGHLGTGECQRGSGTDLRTLRDGGRGLGGGRAWRHAGRRD